MVTVTIILLLFVATAVGLIISLKAVFSGNRSAVKTGLGYGILTMLCAVAIILYCGYVQRALNTIELLVCAIIIAAFSWVSFRAQKTPPDS